MTIQADRTRESDTRPKTPGLAQTHLIQPRIVANPWLVLVVLTLGFFMILLDTTIVNIAIPDIEKGLSATFDQILWILNAYILVYAVLLITAGRLGDLVGPKRLFLTGLVIFTVSSAACGFAQNPVQLIIFRVSQGVGGAILTPQTLAIITTIFPPQKRGAAFGVWGASAGVAAVIGPTLGGFLVTSASWRSIFFVNVPVGIVAVAAAYLLMPELRTERRHDLDIKGVVLASTGLFLGVSALIEGQRYDWGPIVNVVNVSIAGTRWSLVSCYSLLAYSVVLLLLFVLLERRSKEPLLPLSLFRDRNYSVANAVSVGVSYAILGIFLPLTIFLQSVLGFSAIHAGITFIPMSAVSLVTAPIAGRLTDRINGKYVLMFGTACFALGIGLVIALASLDDTAWTFAIPFAIAGLGMGCTFAPMIALAMHDVRPQMAGAASGFINTIRQVGQALGAALGGAILGNAVAGQLPIQAQKLAGRIPKPYRARFVAGFSHASREAERFGAGQGSRVSLPKSVPAQVAHRLSATGNLVFDRAFLNGMLPELWAAVIILALMAIVASFMRGGTAARDSGASEP